MILGIIFVFCAQIILVPIVFSVHKTNNKVLSLFGYIPPAEITELAGKCERFIINHLEDKNEKKETLEKKSDIKSYLYRKLFLLLRLRR